MSITEIVESGKDILNNLKHLDFIFAGLIGHKTRVDEDSLRYVKQELWKDSDNLSLLNKVAEVIQSAEGV